MYKKTSDKPSLIRGRSDRGTTSFYLLFTKQTFEVDFVNSAL